MKVTIVGAGAVGASCAEYIAIKNFASEVVLLDIKEGVAEGKAMDLMQCASLNGFDTRITGSTNDYSKTAGSDIVVITSGIPRKPGMTREELIGINAGIVKTVSTSLLEHSPEAIVIVVSNPMDTMTYLVHKTTGLPRNRIIGMGGALDSARFKYRLAEAGSGGYQGWWCHPHQTSGDQCVVCSRSSRIRPGTGHCMRPEEALSLLNVAGGRIWTQRSLYWSPRETGTQRD